MRWYNLYYNEHTTRMSEKIARHRWILFLKIPMDDVAVTNFALLCVVLIIERFAQ